WRTPSPANRPAMDTPSARGRVVAAEQARWFSRFSDRTYRSGTPLTGIRGHASIRPGSTGARRLRTGPPPPPCSVGGMPSGGSPAKAVLGVLLLKALAHCSPAHCDRRLGRCGAVIRLARGLQGAAPTVLGRRRRHIHPFAGTLTGAHFWSSRIQLAP